MIFKDGLKKSSDENNTIPRQGLSMASKRRPMKPEVEKGRGVKQEK